MGIMRVPRVLLGALMATGLSLPAAAQDSAQLAKRYTDLAGSAANAKSLVTGLRDGTTITLKSGSTLTTIHPPAQKMAYGNVDNALALTQVSLRKRGITKPTPEQLKTALTALLDERAAGQGWGEIAHSLGVGLGEVKDAQDRRERTQSMHEARAATPDRVDKPEAERPLRPERPDRPTRPDRPERPQI